MGASLGRAGRGGGVQGEQWQEEGREQAVLATGTMANLSW